MLLSSRRLDHLPLLAPVDSDEVFFTPTNNELVHFTGESSIQNISTYKYVYLKRYQHLDSNFVKAIVQEYTKIMPDDVVPFNDKLAVLKGNQTLAVPEGVYRRLLDFDFSRFEGYFLVSTDPLSVLAWDKYRQTNVGVSKPKILGKYFLVDDQDTVRQVQHFMRSLQQKGWEYVNYITDYQGLYEEFTREWNLNTKYVMIGDKKYYFVQAKEKYFLGTLERWISESLTLLVNNDLPRVYVFEYPYRGLPPASHFVTVKYLAIRAYSQLVEKNTLLATKYRSIQVHSDLSIEARFFNAEEVRLFKKAMKTFDVLRKDVYVRELDSFYQGILLRYVYPGSVIVEYNDKNYLVSEDVQLDNIRLTGVNAPEEIERDLRTHLLQFYTFCQPKLSKDLPLADLLSIVPEFTSFEPLQAVCEIRDDTPGVLSGMSEFIYQTLEFAWRGYYSYAEMTGLVPFIPYTPPNISTYDILEEFNLLMVNVQGIQVAIAKATTPKIEKWEQEKYLTLWGKYYVRKHDQMSKVLLSLASRTLLR